MRDDYFGFLAYVQARDVVELIGDIDRAMTGLGYVPEHSSSEIGFKRLFRHKAGWALPCVGSGGESDQQPGLESWNSWAFFPIHYADVSLLTKPLLDALRAVCLESEAVLGRSFHPVGLGEITPPELTGAIDFIDWVQYFGPEIVRTLGKDRIERAGFAKVEALGNGAYLALTRGSYLDDWPFAERRALVSRLGIAPRRLVTKSVGGSEEEIRWC